MDAEESQTDRDIDSQYLYVFAPQYARASKAHGGQAPPESRLPMAKWGGPILAISMFWFGWTSYSSISLWVPVLAGLGVGLSVILLFLSLFNYIIDAYLLVAASALASSTVVRSAFGAAFPVGDFSSHSSPHTRVPPTLLLCAQGTVTSTKSLMEDAWTICIITERTNKLTNASI